MRALDDKHFIDCRRGVASRYNSITVTRTEYASIFENFTACHLVVHFVKIDHIHAGSQRHFACCAALRKIDLINMQIGIREVVTGFENSTVVDLDDRIEARIRVSDRGGLERHIHICQQYIRRSMGGSVFASTRTV